MKVCSHWSTVWAAGSVLVGAELGEAVTFFSAGNSAP